MGYRKTREDTDSDIGSLASSTEEIKKLIETDLRRNVGGPVFNSGVTGSRRPNCARCRNHYEKVELKGHKRYCKYKNCKCKKCRLTQERQVIMAKQTAERRRQQLDEDRIKSGLSVPSSPPPETLQRLEIVSATPTPSSPPITAVPTTSNGSASSSSNNSNSSSEPVPLDSILLLLEMFHYQPLDTTTLLYIILRDVTSDIYDAKRRIIEAQGVLRAERGRRSHWPFYYQPQSPTAAVYKPHSTTLGLQFPLALPYHCPPYFVTSAPYNYEKKI